jgi:hypothetical protein
MKASFSRMALLADGLICCIALASPSLSPASAAAADGCKVYANSQTTDVADWIVERQTSSDGGPDEVWPMPRLRRRRDAVSPAS